MRPLLLQLKYRLMRIAVNAGLQRQFHSPFIFREEDPSRQVSPGALQTWAGPGRLRKGLPLP